MRKVLLFTLSLLYLSCTKEKACISYGEGVKKGIAPRKTAVIEFKNRTILKLDYVRSSDDKYSNYAHADLDSERFRNVLSLIDTTYRAENVWMLTLYSERDDLNKGDTLKQAHIKAYLVSYLDNQRRAMLDFKNVVTGKTETYHVSNSYASVKNYFLTDRTDIKVMPGLIDIVNKDLDKRGAVFISKTEDELYYLANGK